MAPPGGTIPPPLPPSVEEAYRRKCIQLKQRMNEVEEANDASRIRLERSKRGIDKLRLERAFLLEQLAKRTSTNVEDSEGSPSPPSTPKEKPLRTKRGHRKPDFLTNINAEGGNIPGTGFIQGQSGPGGQAMTASPSNSDAFRHARPQTPEHYKPLAAATNGNRNGSLLFSDGQVRRPRNAFELFVAEKRAALKGTPIDIDKELATRWQEMGQEGQVPYAHRFQAGDFGFEVFRVDAGGVAARAGDEDMEMGEDGDDDEA